MKIICLDSILVCCVVQCTVPKPPPAKVVFPPPNDFRFFFSSFRVSPSQLLLYLLSSYILAPCLLFSFFCLTNSVSRAFAWLYYCAASLILRQTTATTTPGHYCFPSVFVSTIKSTWPQSIASHYLRYNSCFKAFAVSITPPPLFFFFFFTLAFTTLFGFYASILPGIQSGTAGRYLFTIAQSSPNRERRSGSFLLYCRFRSRVRSQVVRVARAVRVLPTASSLIGVRAFIRKGLWHDCRAMEKTLMVSC